MEDSPKTDPSKAGKTHAAGRRSQRPQKRRAARPGRGARARPLPRRPAADTHVHAHIPAPDVAGAKYQHPVLAQPPEALTGLRLEGREKVAAGVTAVIKSMQFSWSEGGVGARHQGPAGPEPEGRLRLLELRLARPRRAPLGGRVLRERRQSHRLRRRRQGRRPRVLCQAQPGRALAHDRPRPEQRRPPHAPAW